MIDKRKTKRQLIDELTELSRRVAELEVSEAASKQAVAESEGRYRTLVENTLDVVYTCSPDGTITYVSPQARSMGFSPEEIVGRNMAEFIHPEDVERVLTDLQKSIQTGEEFPTAFRLINPSGKVIHVEETGRIISDGVKNTGVTGTIRDISRRKEAEEALRSTTELLERIFSTTHLLIAYMDKDFNFIRVNRAYAEADDRDPDFFIGKNHFDLYTDEDNERIFRRVAETGEPYSVHAKPFEYPEHPDRGTTYWDWTLQPVKDASGEVEGLVLSLLDVTERVRAEDELRRYRDHLEELVEKRTAELKHANKRLRKEITERRQVEAALRLSTRQWQTTFDAISDSVYLLDMEGRILQCNRATEALSGKPSSEIIDRNCWEVLHGTSESIENCPLTRVKQTHCRETLSLPTDDRWLEITVDPVFDEAGDLTSAVHIVSDVTDRKRMEEELQKTQKLESIGILAGGIAHNFNNVLTAILGNVSLAKMYAETGMVVDKIIERLTEAEKAFIRAKDLTQRLLIFSRGGAPILQVTPVVDLLKDSTNFTLSGSNVKCEFSIPDDLWPVEIDEGQMNQVISNILINAVQAMPEGGILKVYADNITLDAENNIPLRPGAYIKVSVEDQGVGIAEQHIQKIFDPFFTTDQKRSGLGLSVANTIISKHKGYISVESRVGTGTTFHIYLPAAQEGSPIEISKIEMSSGTFKGNILVVDDEETIGETVSKMLTSIGYKATVATDGAEAIELCKEAKEAGAAFDAIIMDLIIPGGMGGREAIKRLIEIDPEVRVIVSSGYSTDPIMTDFEKYEFRGVIAKPYRLRELSEVLHRVINRS